MAQKVSSSNKSGAQPERYPGEGFVDYQIRISNAKPVRRRMYLINETEDGGDLVTFQGYCAHLVSSCVQALRNRIMRNPLG